MALRAVVVGAGWASEGHTLGLRHAGVDVVALCGRTPEQAQKMAAKLEIDDVRLDWRQAIQDLEPDVVSIATTGPPHREIVEAVAEVGCDVACDKPLAMSASDAKAMYHAVTLAGIANGYVASHSTGAFPRFVRSVVDEGRIGVVRSVQLRQYHLPTADRPYCWWHQLQKGGGELNTGFTHALQTALRVSGGRLKRAGGVSVHALDRAPIVGEFHDLRDVFGTSVDLSQPKLDFGEVDAESGFIISLVLELPDGSEAIVSLENSYGRGQGSIAVHGTEGSLVGGRDRSPRLLREDGSSDELEIPAHFFANDGGADVHTQKSWNQFFSRFVGHLEGSMAPDYPTFGDGYVACQVIDAVRAGAGMVAIDTPTP